MPLFFWFDLSLEARKKISEIFSLVFWIKLIFHKDILKLTDLYKATFGYFDNSNSVRSRKKSLNSRVHAYYKKKGDTKGRSKTYKNLELYSNKFWTIHDDTTAMYRNVIKIECDLVFVLFPYIPIFFSPNLLLVDILKRFLIENQNIQNSNLFALKKPNNFMKKQK